MTSPVSATVYTQSTGSASLGALGLIPFVTTRAPTTTDVNGPSGPWKVGQVWVDTLNGYTYILGSIAASLGTVSATWHEVSLAAGALNQLGDGAGGLATPTAGTIEIEGGSNITTSAASSTVTVDLDADLVGLTSVTATTFLGTTFDTNVAAAGLTMSGFTVAADGTDANITMVLSPKGTGVIDVTTGAGITVTSPTGDLGAVHDAIGGSVITYARNTDATDPASAASLQALVQGANVGDPVVQLIVVGLQSVTFGIDNSTPNDDIVISKGSVLGTTNLVAFDGANGVALFGAGIQMNTGNLEFLASGGKILSANVATTTAAGANSFGSVTLTGGTATISTTSVTSSSLVYIWRQSIGATGAAATGNLTVGTIVDGVSFVIDSVQPADATALQASDVSVVGWMIVN